jgi:hypothetical protein
MAKSYPLVIASCRGGRNDSDPPEMLPEDQCVEALNVDWWEGTVANKRQGSTALASTFSSGGPFVGVIGSLLRHVPGSDETAAELWGFDGSATPVVGRLAASTQFVAPTMVDNLADAAAAFSVTSASLNGMLFLAYDSAQNRLHVWDPSDSKVRRVGLATPDPPTVATQGGSGLTFTRYYRIRTVDISGSDTKRRSEASTAVSITITDDTGVTVTRPTLPTNEDETHWEVEYADAAAGPWYRAGQIVSATTTYSDTASAISTTNLSASALINLPPPSPRYIVANDNRLVMAGSFETSGGYVTPKDTRVWWTPVLGSNDVGDAERLVLTTSAALGKAYLDVEAAVTGLGLLGSTVYVFSYRRIWILEPTGQSVAPYRRFSLDTGGIGCIHHKTIVQAEDENGAPCLYFLSHKGPYRIGPNGLQYLGGDNETLWATVTLASTTVVGHGVYHSDKHQVWWWVATGGADPTIRIVFDTKLGQTTAGDAVRKGWAYHTGAGARARCSVMFSNTVGATMSRDLKPYIGQTDTGNAIWKCDSTATNDAGTNFQAYVDTREYGRIGANHSLRDGTLIGQVASGVTVTVTARSDFGLEGSATGTALLTAAGSETRTQKRLEGLQTAGVGTFAFRIGDSAAASNQWTVDAVLANVTEQEPKS